MPKLDEKIAAAEQRVKKLKVRQKQLDARKRSIAAKNQRSQDLRRKILVGAIVLAGVDKGEIPKVDLTRWLEAGLNRDDDRALFELSPKPAENP